MRVVGSAVGSYFSPGPDDMIDTFFDGTPMPGCIEDYPFAPATRITGQKLSINGASPSFTDVAGEDPTSLNPELHALQRPRSGRRLRRKLQ
jgi:hypothetical protein